MNKQTRKVVQVFAQVLIAEAMESVQSDEDRWSEGWRADVRVYALQSVKLEVPRQCVSEVMRALGREIRTSI